MPVIPTTDTIGAQLRELNRRLRLLETSSRFNAPVVTVDPTAPRDGDVWIRSDTNQLRARIAGVTKSAALT
jgi:hypothetical protein